MSDDRTPRAARHSVPEAGREWSEQDRRTLIITIGGTLVGNVATVILVGVAIAFVHLNKGHVSDTLVGTLAVAVVAFFLAAAGNRLRRRAQPVSGQMAGIGWLWFVTGLLAALVVVLIWTGLAAGVK